MLQQKPSYLSGHVHDLHQVLFTFYIFSLSSYFTFSLSGFILSYAANMFMLMILYDFRLLLHISAYDYTY
jgi:hypothetical protein